MDCNLVPHFSFFSCIIKPTRSKLWIPSLLNICDWHSMCTENFIALLWARMESNGSINHWPTLFKRCFCLFTKWRDSTSEGKETKRQRFPDRG